MGASAVDYDNQFPCTSTPGCTGRAHHKTCPEAPKRARGLFGKFRVERVAPSSRGIDHSGCRYFVLDPQHDPIAAAALARYAQVARSEGFGPLANDLDVWVREVTP
jgi:hypothetical protein